TDRNAPSSFPVCIFDNKARLLLAPSIPLADKEGARQGQIEVRGSRVWNEARFVAVPRRLAEKVAGSGLDAVAVPFRWNEPISINVLDSKTMRQGHEEGDEHLTTRSRTRAVRIQVDRRDDGSSRAKVDVVSTDGLREFYLDLPLALVGPDG